jgi:hypothetical protein
MVHQQHNWIWSYRVLCICLIFATYSDTSWQREVCFVGCGRIGLWTKEHSSCSLSTTEMSCFLVLIYSVHISTSKQALNHIVASTSTPSNSQSLHSSKNIQRTVPVELWDDIKYPTYSEDPFEFEAINRISNYTYEEKPRYSYWHYTLDWIQEFDSKTLRRGSSIVFVVTVVIIGSTLIALVIPNNNATKTSLDTNSNSSTALPNNPLYTPIRSNNQGNLEKLYTPQQLLELAEQITTSCDATTITHEENRKMCQLLCIDRMCCFEDDKYGCKTDEMCPIYMGCEVLFGSGHNTTSQELSAAKLLQMADEIIGYCDEYMIDPQSADGRKCISQCKGHMCCFQDEGLESSCKEDERVWCEVYEGCEALVGVEGLEDVT